MEFYFNAAPNPLKVALFLEESGLDYTPVPVDTKRGQQHEPGFRKINPNGKVPALVDGDQVLFDSNAILLYLGEKTGQFMPAAADRGQLLSWLMFIASGVGPYSGQSVHFGHFAAEQSAYALKRYRYEANRHWQILEDRLGQGRYMMGETYTILDMAIWGWAPRINFIMEPDAESRFPNIMRLMAELNARPAAQRAQALPGKYTFQQEMDDAAMRHMYPQIYA